MGESTSRIRNISAYPCCCYYRTKRQQSTKCPLGWLYVVYLICARKVGLENHKRPRSFLYCPIGFIGPIAETTILVCVDAALSVCRHLPASLDTWSGGGGGEGRLKNEKKQDTVMSELMRNIATTGIWPSLLLLCTTGAASLPLFCLYDV